MNKKIFSILIILILIVISCNQSKEKTVTVLSPEINQEIKYSKELLSFLDTINNIHIVMDQYVGYYGELSENYQFFEQLKSIASIDELVDLTNHDNNTISCYATWALCDTAYENLDIIFNKFIENNKKVAFESGCSVSENYIFHSIYSYYYRKNYSNRRLDDLFIKLDSIIIYNKDVLPKHLYYALKNRAYNRNYNEQIASLAFSKNNIDAILYLVNWYKADYSEKIKTSLVKYMINTDFSKNNLSNYYEILEILIDFKEEKIDTEVRTKIHEDTSWLKEKKKYMNLFERKHFSTMSHYNP